MSVLKNKLKLKKNIREQVEKEDQKSGGPDKRFLNFYDLKQNEKMSVLIVPDPNGELWVKYKKHGPNMGIRGLETVGCAYHAAGQDCPACMKGFELLELAKETGDDNYKKEAKKWFARDYTVMNVIVLDSPIDVVEADDGNQIKLMYVPFAIEKLIKEQIKEGILDEDELVSTPLVVKMDKNGAGFADYSSSFFSRKAVTEEELEVFDDFKVEPYDLMNLDIIPEAPSTEEVMEWVEKAEQKLLAGDDDNKSAGRGARSSRDEDDSPKARLGGVKSRLNIKKEEKEEEPDYDDDVPMNLSEDEPEQQEEEKESKPAGNIRDRLKNLRR